MIIPINRATEIDESTLPSKIGEESSKGAECERSRQRYTFNRHIDVWVDVAGVWQDKVVIVS